MANIGDGQDRPIDDVRDLATPADSAEPVAERVAAVPPATEPVKEAKKEPLVGSPFERNKTAAVEAYRKSREPKEGEAEFQALPDSVEKTRFGANVETRADREAKREEQRNPPAAAAEQTADAPVETPQVVRRVLKVQGREIPVTEEERDALAQQAYAAGDIIARAKQFRAEQGEILETLRKQAAANHSQPPADGSRPQQTTPEDTKPGDDELDEIIDRIQVGDRHEAKAALKKHGDLIARRLEESIGDLDARIDDTIRTREENGRVARQTMEVWDGFVAAEPAFKENVALQTALATETIGQMKSELLNIGVREEVLERYQRENGLSEADVVGKAYRDLLNQGRTLPSHGEILKKSVKSIRQGLGLRDPAPTPQVVSYDPAERVERKRVLTPQPRRANVAAGSEADTTNREDRMREAVRQRKAYTRGR